MSTPMTQQQFIAHQGAQATAVAEELGLDTVTATQAAVIMERYPLPALRLASQRWSCTGKRNKSAVIAEILEVLENPSVNCGDSYHAAVGHVEASRRWLVRYGYLKEN